MRIFTLVNRQGLALSTRDLLLVVIVVVWCFWFFILSSLFLTIVYRFKELLRERANPNNNVSCHCCCWILTFWRLVSYLLVAIFHGNPYCVGVDVRLKSLAVTTTKTSNNKNKSTRRTATWRAITTSAKALLLQSSAVLRALLNDHQQDEDNKNCQFILAQ